MSRVTCVGRAIGVVGMLGLVACSPPPAAAHAPQAPAAQPPLVLPPGVGEPGSTVLIGDLHGTREIPAFVGQLVSAGVGPPRGAGRPRAPVPTPPPARARGTPAFRAPGCPGGWGPPRGSCPRATSAETS